jgi:hypothetical protein
MQLSCRILTPFAFTLIAIIMVLHVVWVLNEKKGDSILLSLTFSTYVCYLITLALISDGRVIPSYVALGVSTILLISIPSVGGVAKANGETSGESVAALLLGILVCLPLFGLLANVGDDNCLSTK